MNAVAQMGAVGSYMARESKDSEAPANRNTVRCMSHKTGGGPYISLRELWSSASDR